MVITLIRWFIAFVVISAIIFFLGKKFSPAKKQQKAVIVGAEDKDKDKEKEEKGPWYDFRGGFPYELWGPIIGWILLQPCWWLLQPTFCTRVFQSGYYWAFQGVFLFVLLGLLGKHKGPVIFTFVVQIATWGTLILILIGFLYYSMADNGPENIGRLNAWFNDIAKQGEIADVEDKYDDYVDRQNKLRLDKLEERAAKGDLNAVREVKKIKAERERSKAKKKKTVRAKLRKGMVLAETVREIKANERVVIDDLVITQDQIDLGVSCYITQQETPLKTYWFLNATGPNIKINTRQYVIDLNAWGVLHLKGGNKTTNVKIQIIYTGKTGKKPGRKSSRLFISLKYKNIYAGIVPPPTTILITISTIP